jgi:hypothetical protein
MELGILRSLIQNTAITTQTSLQSGQSPVGSWQWDQCTDPAALAFVLPLVFSPLFWSLMRFVHCSGCLIQELHSQSSVEPYRPLH